MAKCHEHQKYQEGKGGISCKEKVGLGKDHRIISLCPLSYVLGLFSMFFPNFCQTQRECWNSSTCGSRRLVVPCSSTTKFCCDKTSSWHCPNQRHSYEVKVCSGGSPTECPGCQDDRLSAEMQDIQTALEQDFGVELQFARVLLGNEVGAWLLENSVLRGGLRGSASCVLILLLQSLRMFLHGDFFFGCFLTRL